MRDPTKPQPPPEPDPADCCGSGCVRCIFDSHDDAMERYRAALAEWNERTDSDND
ncbi:MAG: oxidoreductase-like domain-containing protein [Dokdonella sp.]